MSNDQLIVPERASNIGGFWVGRLLPFRKKRRVGPFIFIDHMGPEELGPGRYLDVDQHPHIGLSTLTYLLEGEIEHRDSLGTVQVIRPGSVNWMIAGSGVTHTERSPAELRNGQAHRLHGYQIWVALSRAQEAVDPSFHHFAAQELPQWEEQGGQFRLLAGEAFGRQAPAPVDLALFLVELKALEDMELDTYGQCNGEVAFCVISGRIEVLGSEIEAGQLLVSPDEQACRVKISAGTQLLIFGGPALPEERYLYWNFAASSKERLTAAKERWQARAFPAVPGDDTYVALPEY